MEKIQQLLDESELAHHEPRRQAGAMVVSIVSRTCCPVSVDGEVHDLAESDLDDEFEFNENANDNVNETFEQDEEPAEGNAQGLDPTHPQAGRPEASETEHPQVSNLQVVTLNTQAERQEEVGPS